MNTRGALLYDDGNGPAAVTVAVSGGIGDHDPSGAPVAGSPATAFFDGLYSCSRPVNQQAQYCSDAVLPDGSRLLLTEVTEHGRLFRTAHLLRADNTEVRVNVNNRTQTRDGLPLTLDQIKAIAMAPGFQEWITPDAAQQAEQAVQPFEVEPGLFPTGEPTPVR
ncbi:hypothetical protein ABTX81_39075 [Kitasatospora sp. NPDC097605]|uniref:hypothetical protein n=1 Tax=Kitasatospora sp. NPDC097605 TaxID=3157226 RepID=UPI0033323FB8